MTCYGQEKTILFHSISIQYNKRFFSEVVNSDTSEVYFTSSIQGKNKFFHVKTNRYDFIYYNDTYYYHQKDTWNYRYSTFTQISQHYHFTLYQPLFAGSNWYNKKIKSDSFLTVYKKEPDGRLQIQSHSIITPDLFIDSLHIELLMDQRGLVDSFYTDAFTHGKRQQFSARLLHLDSFYVNDLDRYVAEKMKIKAPFPETKVSPKANKQIDTLAIIEKAILKYELSSDIVIMDISYIRCAPCMKLGKVLNNYCTDKAGKANMFNYVNFTDRDTALIDWYQRNEKPLYKTFFDTLSPLKTLDIRYFPTLILYNQKTKKYKFLSGFDEQIIATIEKEILALRNDK